MMCLDLKFVSGPNMRHLTKTMDYKWVILLKQSHFKLFELNTYFYGVFYGLSENYKLKKQNSNYRLSNLKTRLTIQPLINL